MFFVASISISTNTFWAQRFPLHLILMNLWTELCICFVVWSISQTILSLTSEKLTSGFFWSFQKLVGKCKSFLLWGKNRIIDEVKLAGMTVSRCWVDRKWRLSNWDNHYKNQLSKWTLKTWLKFNYADRAYVVLSESNLSAEIRARDKTTSSFIFKLCVIQLLRSP